jgi:hypothetical protein
MQLSDYGTITTRETRNGRLEILPTCITPVEYLLEENWLPLCRNLNHGNFRRVRWIYELADHTKVGLFAKWPEKVFTTRLMTLSQGTVWWGGSRSYDKLQAIIDHPLIEEQVIWEAIFLLELAKHGLPAEVPQAIITSPEGKKELIVTEVRRRGEGVTVTGLGREEQKAAIRDLGLVAVDFDDHNVIIDQTGQRNIIDVNRWLWPPYTDEFDRERLELVRSLAATA